MHLHEKQALVDASYQAHGHATLDGKPAVICGSRRPFAHVTLIGPSGIGFNFAWKTAKHIMEDRNGQFTS